MKLRHLITSLLVCASASAFAYTPLFTLTPINVPSVVVAGKTATLSYQVTPNAAQFIHQPNGLLLNNISPAVVSIVSPAQATDCQLNETFSTHSSCTLTLTLDATHLQAGDVVSGKPIFCNHPELSKPMYCSQPAAAINTRVVAPNDPSLEAVTISPSDAVFLYPGESQTVTITNTSGDYVNRINATTMATDDIVITNNCSGTLNQGASCTLVLNTTANPTINALDSIVIEANTYQPITLPVRISPPTLIGGSYITQGTIFEGLIWTKKTNWVNSLPAALKTTPVIFFSAANHKNNWIVLGTTTTGGKPITPWPPRPPYTLHDDPLILESTDHANTFSQLTPNLKLPDNPTLMSVAIDDNLTAFAGFDGDLTINLKPFSVQGDVVPLMITRDQNNQWLAETIELQTGGPAGALFHVTSDGTNQYAAGLEMINLGNISVPIAMLWQRQLDPDTNTYVWNEVDYTDSAGLFGSVDVGTFFGIASNNNTLVAVGTAIDLTLLQQKSPVIAFLPLMIIGNYDPILQQWNWSRFPLPSDLPTPAPALDEFPEISSVSVNPNPGTNEAAWVAVGYTALISNGKLLPAAPMIYVNTSATAAVDKWQTLDLSTLIPPYEKWELDNVSWNGQQWMAVGTRHNTVVPKLLSFQPLVIVSLDGFHWTEVVEGFPKHELTEVAPLIFAVK